MMLSVGDLDSFIEAYREDTDETLSREEASDAARRVFDLIELLATDPEGGIAPPLPETL